MPRLRGRRRRRALTCVVVCVLLAAGVACDSEPAPEPNEPGPPKQSIITFGAWGVDAELEAYRQMVRAYNETTKAVDVELRTWSSSAAMMGAFAGGEKVPDLFLVSRRDLATVRADEMNQPLIDLLDERGVDFGDGYFREGLDAYSGDNDLQCMPYTISPTVMYYNTRLVDFATMAERDLPVPDPEEAAWNLEMFAAAAQFASRPRRGTKGVHVEPTLQGLAPFIYSGGGQVFDDDDEPTSLAFSDDDTRDALEASLRLLRDPLLTLSDEQLTEAPAVEWFKRGKLGILQGTRALTPELRGVEGLEFDVLPSPVLDGEATVGDITGVCISSKSRRISQAADFLVYAISAEAFGPIAESGYAVPSNVEVAVSEEFLQPDQMPAEAGVFNASIGDLVVPPLLDDYAGLDAAVADDVRALLTTPVLDLDALTEQIDEASRVVLDPDYEPPTESPSGSPSGSPSDGPTEPTESPSEPPTPSEAPPESPSGS